MAPRRRKAENSDMPTGLAQIKMRGVMRFRYRYPDGTDYFFPKDTTRQEANEASAIFNAQYRAPSVLMMEKADKYNRTIKYWLPKIKARVFKEEKLGDNAKGTFNSDCDLLLEHFGDVYSKSINLETVNDFLEKAAGDKSANVYNRKISFLKKVFSYMVDMSAMQYNWANDKKSKPKEQKKRKRLKLADYKLMIDHAPDYLKTAMQLALQTTHATLEISRIKYRHCRYFDKPELIDGELVYGYMRIHRQKVQHKEASRVEIPITQPIREIIESSRDELLCPYVVHRRSRYANQISEGCDHPNQVSSKYISRGFSNLRDDLKLYANLDKDERPTFHEIRALAIHLFTEAGYDPQARAAHTDSKSTKIYQENHVQWVRVPVANLAI